MASYIPKEALQNLNNYKYSTLDESIVSRYVLQPYWNYMIRFVPWGIAPNLITLIGTLGLLFNYLLVAYHVPQFEGFAPRWVYLSSAIAIEWYQLMDNLDGRQARRTKTSSPLGELFDHGCDSLAVVIGASTAACIYQFGSGIDSIVSLIVMSLAFWCASWEELHTGTLYLGIFNGPADGLKLLFLCFLWTFFYGPEFWLLDWKTVICLPSSIAAYLPDIEGRRWCVYFFSCFPMVVTSYFNIKSVLTTIKAQGKSTHQALSHLFTFFIYFTMVVVWFATSHALWRQYPHPLHFAVGVGFAQMTSGLILAHLCKMKYHVIQRPMIPLLIVTLNSVVTYVLGTHYVPDTWVMLAYLCVTILMFVDYAYHVITELCTFLNIRCFRIPNNTPKTD